MCVADAFVRAIRVRVSVWMRRFSQIFHTRSCSADFQVCCIPGFQTRNAASLRRAADLEIGDTAGWETCATPNAFRNFPVRIPKGFHPKAQGCDEGATLGKSASDHQPQRGCGLFPFINHPEFPKEISATPVLPASAKLAMPFSVCSTASHTRREFPGRPSCRPSRHIFRPGLG